MESHGILNFSREGGWITNDGKFFYAAIRNLALLSEQEAIVIEKEQELRKQHADDEHGYVDYLLTEDKARLNDLALMVEILCCMSVEAFLNYYGVKRLGEEFYKRNYERLGISQKLEALLATCKNIILPSGSQITKLVRKMFDRRNYLVHPKAAEFNFDKFEQGNYDQLIRTKDIMKEATERVEEMKQFYIYFVTLDPDTRPELAWRLSENDG